MALVVKNPPTNAETLEMWVRSPGWEKPLKEGMATHSSIPAWRIPWTEELAGCSPRGHKESDSTERQSTAQHSYMWWKEWEWKAFYRLTQRRPTCSPPLWPIWSLDKSKSFSKFLWKCDKEAVKWKSYVVTKTSLSCLERPLFSISSSSSDSRYSVHPVCEPPPQKSLSLPAVLA